MNRENCGIMIDLGASYYKSRQSMEKEVKKLILMVENGSPLRGKCQLCPKIKISKQKNTRWPPARAIFSLRCARGVDFAREFAI